MPTKRGFTLIELLLVITLIGIMSLISYPLYTEHLTRVRRSMISAKLIDLAGRLEKYYASNNSYHDATFAKLAFSYENQSAYYQLEIIAKNDFYTLKASPIGSQTKDLTCGTLIIDQSGSKNITGTGKISECWL